MVVQENHSFDSYFGRYCTAPAGSNPTCTEGPACCEAGPATDPGTSSAPTALTDDEVGSYDPSHGQDCELSEIDSGKMDQYVGSATCGDKRNFAYADGTALKSYWDLAASFALADRYFQPVAGASSSNDMYFARAKFVFKDNNVFPDATGKECAGPQTPQSFTDQTIGDLLVAKGVSWAWFGEGYQAMVDAVSSQLCPDPPPDCAFQVPLYPCVYDPSDVPFAYYPNFRDNPKYMRDYAAFTSALAGGTLPQVSFVKALGFRSEHPGHGDSITAGETFVGTLVQNVQASKYASDTLVLLTYDESGGYFDHVPPPPTSPVDGQPYGPRVPLLAIGPFAKKNFISHTTMEHSSVVKFIEWNWLGQTGQLGNRDASVNNIGSLLDPAATGVPVPE